MTAERPSLLPGPIRESYAARLGVALTVAVLVMVGFGALISAQASASLQEDVQTELQTLSETRADELDTWLGTVRRDAAKTAQFDVFASGDADAIDARLEEMIRTGMVPQDVVGVHYFNTSSKTIERSTFNKLEGVNAAEQGAPFATDPPTFTGPDDTYVSKPFSVPAVDHPIVAVITPVPGDSDHALVYMADLTARASAISNANSETKTVVVNTDRTYVAHPNTSKILTKHGDRGGMNLSAMQPGMSMFMEHHDQLMGMTRMQSNNWVVMVHSSKAQAYALGAQINSDLVGLVLLAVITLGLVGVTIGTNTIISLRRVADRAGAMADGDLDVDLKTTREDEIGTVYASFADMRDSIREKIREAEDAREDAESAREEAESAKERAEREAAEMEEMNDRLRMKADEYQSVLTAVAEGDLTRRVDPDSENESMAAVGESINEALDGLERTIANMKTFARDVVGTTERVSENAERVDQASQQVTEAISEIFQGTSEQSERLQTAANEMENLSATAEEVASSAQQVADTSQQAAEVGEEGREAAQQAIEEMNAIEAETAETVEAINELDDELDEIGQIVSVITEIVEQTNMLALNASIEAAHADAEGAGFAVVADEIKGLAEETKEAAGDIEDRIEGIQSQAGETVETMEATSERVSDGVETVEGAVDALETIVEYTEEVDTGIQEIDAATEEQARTAQEVMEMIDELSSISQQTATRADTVAGAADDQSHSITEVSQSAADLRRQADELETALERFDTGTDAAAGGTAGATASTDD